MTLWSSRLEDLNTAAGTTLTRGVVAVSDALVSGNLLSAASSQSGTFALPVAMPSTNGAVTLTATRVDLGLTGTLAVKVPSQGNTLKLLPNAFGVVGTSPDASSPIEPGSVFSVMLSLRAREDAANLACVKLLKGTEEISAKRSLSQDGKTGGLVATEPKTGIRCVAN